MHHCIPMDNKSLEAETHTELVDYYNTTCFSPVMSTWANTIKLGSFILWWVLTEELVKQQLYKSINTAIGSPIENLPRILIKNNWRGLCHPCRNIPNTSSLCIYIYPGDPTVNTYTYMCGHWSKLKSRCIVILWYSRLWHKCHFEVDNEEQRLYINGERLHKTIGWIHQQGFQT